MQMRKFFLLSVIIGALLAVTVSSFAQEQKQEEDVTEPVLVLQEAQKRKKTTVAAIAYLVDDALEVTVITRMYATKPHLYNIILVGPGLGRLSPQERQTLFPTVEDEDMEFATRDMEGGIIRFSPRVSKKKAKGTLTKEIVKFRIPTDRIKPKGRYELRIKVESLQRPGQFQNFKFDLKKLSQAISKQE